MTIFLYFLNIVLIILFLTGIFLYDYELLNIKNLKYLWISAVFICLLSLFLHNNLVYESYMLILSGIIFFYATTIFALIIMKIDKLNAIFQTILYVVSIYASLIVSDHEIIYLILIYILLVIIGQWLTNACYLFMNKKILEKDIDNNDINFKNIFSSFYLTYIPIVIIIIFFFNIY